MAKTYPYSGILRGENWCILLDCLHLAASVTGDVGLLIALAKEIYEMESLRGKEEVILEKIRQAMRSALELLLQTANPWPDFDADTEFLEDLANATLKRQFEDVPGSFDTGMLWDESMAEMFHDCLADSDEESVKQVLTAILDHLADQVPEDAEHGTKSAEAWLFHNFIYSDDPNEIFGFLDVFCSEKDEKYTEYGKQGHGENSRRWKRDTT